MAAAAGRRNILRDLTSLGDGGDGSNTLFPSTPTSPDESVIQNRGHHKKSATYNFDAPDPIFFKTPTKSPKKVSVYQRLLSPVKTTPVRSSPRKRLNLTPDKFNFNEASISEMTITCKRYSLSKVTKGHLQNFKTDIPMEKGLKALSHEQLVELVSGAIQSSPEIGKLFGELLPVPDLSPAENRLHMLQRNVYRAFPRNVWGSQDGSFCYLRVRTHLEAFKKECLEMCNHFMDSHHWPAAFEFIFLAWKLTIGLPDWDNVSHNKIKSFCMKQLVTQCISALKKANLDKDALTEVLERMYDFAEDSTVGLCIKYAEDLKKNLLEVKASQ